MSSKSILIISSYTISKLARFLRHSVYPKCLRISEVADDWHELIFTMHLHI